MSQKKKKKTATLYWSLLFLFGIVLAAVGFMAVKAMWAYAEEYETSLPEKTINEYMDNLGDKLWNDKMQETISSLPHEFQTDEECAELIKNMIGSDLTYSQTTSDFSIGVDNNVYSLLCGSGKFGEVTIIKDPEAKAESVDNPMIKLMRRFVSWMIPDDNPVPWVVYSEDFYFEGLFTSQSVTVPSDYSVSLNGHVLGEEYISETGIHYDFLEDLYETYPDIPTKVTYTAENVFGNLDFVIHDESGNEVTINPEMDDSQYFKAVDDSLTARFNTFAQNMMPCYLRLLSGTGVVDYAYNDTMMYAKQNSSFAKAIYQSYLDVSQWHHTISFSVDSVVFNGATHLYGNCYMLEVTAAFTSVNYNGTTQSEYDYRIIVVDEGNQILAIDLSVI